jgi:hypothetical protein
MRPSDQEGLEQHQPERAVLACRPALHCTSSHASRPCAARVNARTGPCRANAGTRARAAKSAGCLKLVALAKQCLKYNWTNFAFKTVFGGADRRRALFAFTVLDSCGSVLHVTSSATSTNHCYLLSRLIQLYCGSSF